MNQRNKEKMLKMEAEDDGAIGDEAANHAAPVSEKEEEAITPGKIAAVGGEVDLLGGDGTAISQASKGGNSQSASGSINEEDQGNVC